MMNLFEDKSEKVKVSSVNEELSFDIASDEAKELVQIDWKNCHAKKVTLNFSGNAEYEVVELDLPSDLDIVVNVDDNVTLHQSIASFVESENVSYEVNLNENSTYHGALADFSVGKKKMNFVCNLKKPYAHANWNLASLATDKDNKTYYVSFYHYAPHTFARMENYGVCEDEAALNFLGTSSIEKGAKQSATHQSAKIMVFDPTCHAKASPSLCIDENDVEASHAAVVGQINEEHIFYLTSRGIPEEQAKKLITLGYLNPILPFFSDEGILEKIKANLERRF